MDKVMVFDDKMKMKLGILCFIPAACFLITFVYYISLMLPLTHGHPEPSSIVGITSNNYDTLFIMFAASAIITAPIFIYNLIILARLKSLNSARKTEWVVLLSVMAPISSMFFWGFVIKHAHKYESIYPDIA